MSLSILHVMRAPVGGLFRHVVDLARGQAGRGHRVGIVADASTGGEAAARTFAALEPDLALGISRVEMSRELGVADVAAGRHVVERLTQGNVDVVHGHGSKGGAYARLAGGSRLKVYTPHGGSLHYSRATPVGFVYLTLEQLLVRRTDLFLFESAYGLATFHAKVADPTGRARVVHNGVGEAEFVPVSPDADATDLLFIGELRHLKGVDVLLDAIALIRGDGRPLAATIVGAGPDADTFRQQATHLGLEGAVTFTGAMPAREAFRRGRLMVVPSRAESLPYVVLEAAAAGLPQIATDVGGIGEIFGQYRHLLVPAGDAQALAAAVQARLAEPERTERQAERLRVDIKSGFSVETMTSQVLEAYEAGLAGRAARREAA